MLGIGLGWLWGQDDRVAGLIADRMLGKAELPETPVTDLSQAPTASWWGSTAGHLYLRALAEGRSAGDPGAEERARFLLNAARNAAPLEPQVRYALAMAGQSGEDSGASPRPIGLSRDVVALAATGRAMHRAGRVEAALKAYRSALSMAEAIEVERTPPAPFDEDRQVRRFALPGEDLMVQVIEGMARLDWPFAEWSKALPLSARAAVACHRVLRRIESPDADRALDLVPEDGDGPAPPVELAARAEAMAFRGRWAEAETLYRGAIEGMASDTIRRSWWFNAGSIAGRAGDLTRANEAWEKAKTSAPGDPIHRRVAEAQVHAGVGSRPNPGTESGPGVSRRDHRSRP